MTWCTLASSKQNFKQHQVRGCCTICPKVLILYKLQACSPPVLDATSCKTKQIRTFSYIVGKLKGTSKKAKKHSLQPIVTCMQHAYSLSVVAQFFCADVHNFSQDPIKNGSTYQSFFLNNTCIFI